MESQPPNSALLARYLADKATREEKRVIEQWLKRDPDNKQKVEDFGKIWELTEESNTDQSRHRLEKEWKQLKKQLAAEEGKQSVAKNHFTPRRSTISIHSTFQKIIRVAAIFLIAGLLGALSYFYWSPSHPASKSLEPVLREVSTAMAQRANLTLGDGTNVILNADSEIKFPPEFERDIREVHLKGEAYFNVVRNPDKPFIIYSGETTTRVLGTSFGLRSYPEEGQVQVIVEEGRVLFRPSARRDSSAAVLTKNELGQYISETHDLRTTKIEDMGLYLGWREGALKFKEMPMRKVAREIERQYKVQVAFGHNEIADMSLTAFLKSRSIRNVLDIIATSLNINYRLEDDNVTFYRE